MISSVTRRNISNIAKKGTQAVFSLRYNGTMSPTKYETLAVSVPKQFVYMVQLNRPAKLNVINNIMWKEFKQCFDELAIEPECRAIVLSAAGKAFCAGIDLQTMIQFGQDIAKHEDVARKCKVVECKVKEYQDVFTSIEKCPKPVIAAVHGACIGAGVDMISAADIRYCSSNAWFQIKEVDIGMAADVGSLQRVPKVMGSDSLVRELIYTGRKFLAEEALKSGFVNNVLDNEESLFAKAIELAEQIASKSPVAVQNSKLSVVFSRDHSVQEGLDHIANRNQAMLQSEDLVNAVMAQASKDEPPIFAKL